MNFLGDFLSERADEEKLKKKLYKLAKIVETIDKNQKESIKQMDIHKEFMMMCDQKFDASMDEIYSLKDKMDNDDSLKESIDVLVHNNRKMVEFVETQDDFRSEVYHFMAEQREYHRVVDELRNEVHELKSMFVFDDCEDWDGDDGMDDLELTEDDFID